MSKTSDDNNTTRRDFRRFFFKELLGRVMMVWPILPVLLGMIVALGTVVGLLEHWHFMEAIYFAFISGLTIGYGDLVPKQPLSRVLAVAIGLVGVLLVGLVVAIGVSALDRASERYRGPQ